MKQTVIGMAGHIDHGKTSIIKSLTGTQTERYAEELDRGLTIDIGFAFLNDNIALIDVPGHEKFIKNMLTGSYGIDFSILVIAADDGVMPQTLEHFEILKLLGIKQGLIVLNKIDLVEEDWIELLVDDINKMTKNSFLENCKIIKTSTINNIGIEELNNEIIKCSQNIPEKYDRGFFRMAVDRAFSIKGYGTVVTGTVTSGKISIGETIDVIPNSGQYKIRGIHSHGKSVDTVKFGSRAAINIGNLDIGDVFRGYQISTPGYLIGCKNLIVSCTLLENLKKPLKQNQRIRVHIGTNESIGRISLVNTSQIEPGQSSIFLIKLESNIITTMEDKFILRTFSPLTTIGGGTVIERVFNYKWKEIRNYIINLQKLKKNEIKKYIIESQKFMPFSYKDSKVRFGLGNKQIEDFIDSNNLSSIEYKKRKWLITKEQLKKCEYDLIQILDSNKDIYDIGFSKSIILQKTKGDEKFLDFLLEYLEDNNKIYKKDEKWIVQGTKIVLDDKDKLLKENIISILDKQKFSTESLEELSESCNCKKEKLKKILYVLEKDNLVIRINESLMFSIKNLEALKKDLLKFFSSNEILSMKDFKDLTNTSRKFAVPLLEYFDKIKFTYRIEGGRKLIK